MSRANLIEGLVKKLNKIKKNEKVWGLKPGDKSGPPQKDVHGNPKIDTRIAKHMAARGVKKVSGSEDGQSGTQGDLKQKLRMNSLLRKKKANVAEASNPKAEAREKAKSTVTPTKAGKGHAALNAAGLMRRMGNKQSAKTFLKMSKGFKESFDRAIIEVVSKTIIESKDMENSISNAGGSAEEYRKIKASKDPKATSGQKKHATRASVLGKKATDSKTAGTEKYRGTGQQKKPMPVNLKLKSKGKPVNPDKVRGKAVNTSRGSGKEGAKADANQSAFDNLVKNLSKRGD